MGNKPSQYAKALQTKLEKNHFQAGMIDTELKELLVVAQKFNMALNKECKQNSHVKSTHQLEKIVNWVLDVRNDEYSSEARREIYRKISDSFGGTKDLNKFCKLQQQGLDQDAFEDEVSKEIKKQAKEPVNSAPVEEQKEVPAY